MRQPSSAVTARAVRRFGVVFSTLTAALVSSQAAAQSGVSDDRVSLPDGPGSIGGVGENVNVVGNMGAMSLSLPFRIPAGFEGVTPELGLRYSSSEGSGVVGIGWAMDVPSIERMTSRGLPEYAADDEFVADGSEQLVKVSEGMTGAVYRARFERSFARYTWHGVADGKAGYFTAEYPDGTISYFGADRTGAIVPTARVTHPQANGVFRYQLVDTVDPFGKRVHYTYTSSNGYPLLDSVDYVHDASDKPRFSVRMVYGARPDVLSDGKPGFELLLSQRLTSVRVFSGAEQIRQYDLEYESEATSGGMTRLAGVTERGRGGVVHPIHPRFSYSQTLGGACTTGCQQPFVVDMGTLPGGVDLQAGNATLIDINGDALPDMLDTTGGVHRFFYSKPSTDGRPTFAASAVTSAATTGAFALTNPAVQLMDVNGDGFTDMVSARTGRVLCNNGSGDWSGSSCIADASLDIDLEDDTADVGFGDPLHVRFFDYDNDKRIDFLRTTSTNATDVRRDTGAGFRAVSVTPIGEVFDDSALTLADMNGDNLLDPVILSDAGTLRFRLNFGFGRWGDWQSVSITGLGQSDLQQARLEDLNGDGLDDILVVNATSLKVLLNRNADRFDAPIVIDGSKVSGTLPEKTPTTTVLVADMNANGSEDVVWVSSSGRVQFLDLFPVRPNLLSRVENGIGMVQSVAYGTSLAELARDKTWAYRLSYAMNVVKRVDQWVTLTGSDGAGLHDVTEYSYHDGYYDGVEKQFRGFARTEEKELGDALDSQQPGLTQSSYDVGKDDPYYNGLMLRSDVFALDGGTPVPLRSVRNEYGECSVGGVPSTGLTYPVRHICEKTRLTVLQEGAPESEWATLKTTLAYDGYGNVTLESDLGVDHMGPPEAAGACRPCAAVDDTACGPTCGGDELYTESRYVSPEDGTNGKWFLHEPARVTVYGADGGPTRETLYYYDGPDFTGLPLGKLTHGKQTREQRRVSAADGDFIDVHRRSFDEHGNVAVELDPLGTPGDDAGHVTRYGYDASYGLNVVSTERAVSADHALRREYAYELAFNEVSESTEWMVVRGGDVVSARDARRFRYDEHGRTAKVIEPGDSEAAPSLAYVYELGDPVTRIRVEARSKPGSDVDSVAYQCLDGRGRKFQGLLSVASGRYLADGFLALNSRGTAVRTYQPYEQASEACATAAPEGVAFTALKLDPLGRTIETTHPDGALYGSASTERTVYAPLAEIDYDEEDTAADSPYTDTPTTKYFDGQERVVAIERALNGATAVTRIRHDSLGNVRGFIDDAGNTRTQELDLLDRVVSVDDPNTGLTQFAYDAASNLIRRESSAADVVRYAHDGLNRVSEIWSEPDRDGTLVSYSYDELPDCKACSSAAGALAEVRYPVVLGDARSVGFDRYGYDVRRRRVYEARSLEGHLFETSHVYDGLDRLVSTTHPDGRTLTRAYDGAERLVAIDGVVDALEYDARGDLARELLANGVETRFDHDARMRLSGHAVTAAGDDALFALAFEHDRVGNLKAGRDDSGAAHLARAFALAYDPWYRLTSATLAKGGADEETIRQSYDTIDNLTARTSSLGGKSRAQAGDFAYEAAHPNAVASFGDVSLSYTADGDLAERGSLALSWDYQGRLIQAERDGELLGQFAYGPEQERVLKDEAGHVAYYVSPEFEVRDGVSVVYPRDGQRRFARLEDRSFAVQVLDDLDGDEAIGVADAVLAQAAGDAAALPRLLAAGAKRVLFDGDARTTFLHQDHLENVIAATDEAGAVTAERAFYDHGDERVATAFVDEHGFGAQDRDESTGLVHYQYRYLDAQSGRWASADPLYEVASAASFESVAEAANPYAFAANNYGTSVDRLGLKGQGPKSKSASAKRAEAARKKAQKRNTDARKRDQAQLGKRGAKSMELGGTASLLFAKATSPKIEMYGRRDVAKARAKKAARVAAKGQAATAAPKRDILQRIGAAVMPFAGRKGYAGTKTLEAAGGDGGKANANANANANASGGNTSASAERAAGIKVVGAVIGAIGTVAGGTAGFLLAPAADDDDAANAGTVGGR